MKEDSTPTITARRRIPSAKLRLRIENAKRLKALNDRSKTVRQRKKGKGKQDPAHADPQNQVAISRLPKIKKNNLSEPPRATSKFKKRQVHKSWLPTHLWHAKRAHMTRPSEPLWRMAIPISPTEKVYRPSHRSSGGRGCIAWDMSYMSTIGCQGVEGAIESMLKAIGFHGERWSGVRYKRWTKGSRSAEGWAFERDNEKQAIAPLTVFWDPEMLQADQIRAAPTVDKDTETVADSAISGASPKIQPQKKKKAPNRRLLIRVHPAVFHELWTLLLKVAKTQRPQVMLEDLRFEVGSVEISGPGSTEALLGVLQPAKHKHSDESPASTWISLAGLTNPASLPQGALLAFDISDPRLNHPPRQVQLPRDDASASALTELIVSWPPDRTQTTAGIFHHRLRCGASNSLPSHKAINRRKSLTSSGQHVSGKETDPLIPALLFTSRPGPSSSGSQGSWTVMLPWKCVDPVWRSLLYYPLSSGGTPRYGGLDEKRQICFEHGIAWFPADTPGTKAGQAWERTESDKRFDSWLAEPASRRISWDRVDLGNGIKGEHGRGWACDWEYLLAGATHGVAAKVEKRSIGEKELEDVGPNKKKEGDAELKTRRQRMLASARTAGKGKEDEVKDKGEDQSQSNALADQVNQDPVASSCDAATPSNPLVGAESPLPFIHLPAPLAAPFITNSNSAKMPSLPSLFTIRITLLTRGTPNPCARVYRLPSAAFPAGEALRKQWLVLDHLRSILTFPDGSNQTGRTKKDKLNHRGDRKAHKVYQLESLDHINYVPPDAPPEFFKEAKETVPPPSNASTTTGGESRKDPRPSPTREEKTRLTASLNVPDIELHTSEKHPVCPHVNDLIGFVTTGAYNLAEGQGMAIGSLWLQRVIDGWRTEDLLEAPKANKQRERERRLCIVRNAGEGVGRLGIWEVCG